MRTGTTSRPAGGTQKTLPFEFYVEGGENAGYTIEYGQDEKSARKTLWNKIEDKDNVASIEMVAAPVDLKERGYFAK